MQSGIAFDLHIASLAADGQIVEMTRRDVGQILDTDPSLQRQENMKIASEMTMRDARRPKGYSLIS
ncbi:MAG: hypothetical protein K2K78_04325, partial [Muribaculaceae bacterium]|nr:hypothetical protein [Muribaculaceae bacterium]